MRDFVGHDVQVGDIVIVSIENQQLIARVREVYEVDNTSIVGHVIAIVSLLKYAAGATPLLRHVTSEQMVWYSSAYQLLPDSYVHDLFAKQNGVNHA